MLTARHQGPSCTCNMTHGSYPNSIMTNIVTKHAPDAWRQTVAKHPPGPNSRSPCPCCACASACSSTCTHTYTCTACVGNGTLPIHKMPAIHSYTSGSTTTCTITTTLTSVSPAKWGPKLGVSASLSDGLSYAYQPVTPQPLSKFEFQVT